MKGKKRVDGWMEGLDTKINLTEDIYTCMSVEIMDHLKEGYLGYRVKHSGMFLMIVILKMHINHSKSSQ